MNNKILLIVVVFLSGIYGLMRSFYKETSFLIDDLSEIQVTVKDNETQEIISFDMEEYLVGVIAGEMPASFNMEALKAQAVASRTYAYYKVLNSNLEYDLTTDSSTQVYLNDNQMREKWHDEYNYYIDKITKAIRDTTDEVLTSNGQVISAYYFAMSNGFTENGKTVFGEDKTYLTSVLSKEDTSNRNFEVIKEFSKIDFCNKLNIACDQIIISNEVRNSANRVNSININNKDFTGIELRKILELRSTDFTILVAENTVNITTRGYGHGVGMSQYGANTMAKDGASYLDILSHYYTGTEISSITSIN